MRVMHNLHYILRSGGAAATRRMRMNVTHVKYSIFSCPFFLVSASSAHIQLVVDEEISKMNTCLLQTQHWKNNYAVCKSIVKSETKIAVRDAEMRLKRCNYATKIRSWIYGKEIHMRIAIDADITRGWAMGTCSRIGSFENVFHPSLAHWKTCARLFHVKLWCEKRRLLTKCLWKLFVWLLVLWLIVEEFVCEIDMQQNLMTIWNCNESAFDIDMHAIALHHTGLNNKLNKEKERIRRIQRENNATRVTNFE